MLFTLTTSSPSFHWVPMTYSLYLCIRNMSMMDHLESHTSDHLHHCRHLQQGFAFPMPFLVTPRTTYKSAPFTSSLQTFIGMTGRAAGTQPKMQLFTV